MSVNETQRQQSLNYLISIGMFIPYRGLKLYHGRTSKGDTTEWKVEERFNNSDDNTGNSNVNGISALSTAEYQTAKDFADKRNNLAYIYVGKPIDTSTSKVYRIVSTDKDAMIFNLKFDYSKLSPQERVKCEEAMKILTVDSLSELAPVRFEHKDIYIDVHKALIDERIKRNERYVSYDAMLTVYNDFVKAGKRINKDILVHVGGAMNAQMLIKYEPKFVFKRYVLEKDSKKRGSIKGLFGDFDGPLSMEYVSSWAYSNHLIGCKVAVSSATVGREIDNYLIFDKTKINTEKAVGDKIRSVINNYGQIANAVENFSADKNMLNNLKMSSPNGLVNVLYKMGIQEPFLLSSGVSEGFLVGEHTETVLRVFEDSFGDDLPENLKPFLRFCLLAHDIGKGYAYQKYGRNKTYEKVCTKDYCKKHLFPTCQIDPKFHNLIYFIIDESQSYVDKIYIKDFVENESSSQLETYKNMMITRCSQELKKVLGRELTKDEIRGLIGICKTVLTCDGGAYTRYAVTRDKKGGYYYRNGNDRFTKSFENPADIRNREVKFPEMI